MKRFHTVSRLTRRIALLVTVCLLAAAVPAVSHTIAAGETPLPTDTPAPGQTEGTDPAETGEPAAEEPEGTEETPAPLLLARARERIPAAAHENEGFVFYHSKDSPYYRISPHRASSRDADGKTDAQTASALFTLIDLNAYGGKAWSPDPTEGWSLNNPGNYLAVYCCDLSTPAVPGTHYRRVNLEDAAYYGRENAAHIRAVVQNSYPFVPVADMIQNLIAAGVMEERDGVVSAPGNWEGARKPKATLSESELLSAVQLAVWKYANAERSRVAIQSPYTKTLAMRASGVIHPDPASGGERNLPWVGANIEAIYTYLTGLPGAAASSGEGASGVVVSGMTFTARQTDDGGDGVCVRVRLRLNGSIGPEDRITLTAAGTDYALQNAVGDLPVLTAEADGAYTLTLTGLRETDTVKLTVRGAQRIARGVYFYEPYGGHRAAQSFVGAAQGETEAFAEGTFAVSSLTQTARLKKIALLTPRDVEMPLEGAVFRLVLRRAGRPDLLVRDGLTTDAEGRITVRRLCPPGEDEAYVFVETQPPQGYRLPEEPEAAADLTGTVRLVNPAETVGSVTLEKRDGNAPELKLPDAGFLLYRTVREGTELSLGEFATGGDGLLTVGNLPAGRYRFEEITPPEGYRLNAEPSTPFEITAEAPHASLVVENRATLTVGGEKRWSDAEDRYGLRPEQITVYLYCGDAPAGRQEVSADTDWRYTFADLPIYDETGRINAYRVSESPVPGYRADYDETGIQNTLRTADLVLVKQDRDGNPLQGAGFSLKGGVFSSNTASGEQGELRFTGLPVGEYLLTETRAPEGFRLAPAPWRVFVSDPNTAADGTLPLVVTVEGADGKALPGNALVNEPVLTLPKTGGAGTAIYLAGGSLLILLAAGGCMISKKKLRREL